MNRSTGTADFGKRLSQDLIWMALLLGFLLTVARYQSGLLGIYFLGLVIGFTGPNGAIFSMFLTSLLIALNPVFLPEGGASFTTLSRWLCFLPPLYHLIVRKRVWRSENTAFAVLFAAYMFTATLSSYSLVASAAKIVAFVSGLFLTIRLAELCDLKHVRNKLAAFIAIFALVGLPTVAIPSVGFNRNATGFQSLLSHPQTYAVFAAIATPYLINYAIQNRSKFFSLTAALLSLTLALTESRTGVFATVCLVDKRAWNDHRLKSTIRSGGTRND